MRSNSGNDQSRDNLRDPTIRDRERLASTSGKKHVTPKAPADHRQGQKH